MLQGQTLWELLEERVAATPDALMAVDEDERRITFAEYREESERAAAGLAAEGVQEGDVVSWQLPTWIESLVLVGALSRLGAIQNPLLPIYREREVGFTVNQADATMLIVPSVWKDFDFGAMANGIASAKGDTKVLIADKELPEGDPATLAPLPAPGSEPGIRWLFYTSGTTADP
jgi:non-ribosomal peptide synthetase component E (peptide arylation enzyme)